MAIRSWFALSIRSDTGVMKVLKKALKGSTTTVLQYSFPKIVQRDATTMADVLQLSLPKGWIHPNQYVQALKLAKAQQQRILPTDDSTFCVLTSDGLKTHKKITHKLVGQYVPEAISNAYRFCIGPNHMRIVVCIAHIRYNAMDANEDPRGVKRFEKLVAIRAAIVKVTVATDAASICPCEANPYDLFCPCKGARKVGICYHILGVTHCIMRAKPPDEQRAICNLKYMVTRIDSKPKKGHKRKKKNPFGHCLEREDGADGDGEDASPPPLALDWS